MRTGRSLEVEVSAATCPSKGRATYAESCRLGVGSAILRTLPSWL